MSIEFYGIRFTPYDRQELAARSIYHICITTACKFGVGGIILGTISVLGACQVIGIPTVAHLGLVESWSIVASGLGALIIVAIFVVTAQRKNASQPAEKIEQTAEIVEELSISPMPERNTSLEAVSSSLSWEMGTYEEVKQEQVEQTKLNEEKKSNNESESWENLNASSSSSSPHEGFGMDVNIPPPIEEKNTPPIEEKNSFSDENFEVLRVGEMPSSSSSGEWIEIKEEKQICKEGGHLFATFKLAREYIAPYFPYKQRFALFFGVEFLGVDIKSGGSECKLFLNTIIYVMAAEYKKIPNRLSDQFLEELSGLSKELEKLDLSSQDYVFLCAKKHYTDYQPGRLSQKEASRLIQKRENPIFPEEKIIPLLDKVQNLSKKLEEDIDRIILEKYFNALNDHTANIEIDISLLNE